MMRHCLHPLYFFKSLLYIIPFHLFFRKMICCENPHGGKSAWILQKAQYTQTGIFAFFGYYKSVLFAFFESGIL